MPDPLILPEPVAELGVVFQIVDDILMSQRRGGARKPRGLTNAMERQRTSAFGLDRAREPAESHTRGAGVFLEADGGGASWAIADYTSLHRMTELIDRPGLLTRTSDEELQGNEAQGADHRHDRRSVATCQLGACEIAVASTRC
jgi:hypothetical protein